MRRRGMILFVVFNILVSAGVTYGIMTWFNSQNPGGAAGSGVRIVTVEIKITTTPPPTQPVLIITATLPTGIVALPTGLLGTPDAPGVAGSTSAPQPVVTDASGSLVLPPNCILHTIEEGDSPSSIAEVYGVNFLDIMRVNGLTDETARLLRIGQQLIIPLEGCTLSLGDIATATPTFAPLDTLAPGETRAATAGPTPTPTVTLPPTAVNAQVTITQVLNPNDVTAEGVEIRNNGDVVDLTGWTISDGQGNTYTFGQKRVFTNGLITLYSGVGQETPIAVYWGRTTPVWQPGMVVTLTDADGVVQSTFRVPAPVNLP